MLTVSELLATIAEHKSFQASIVQNRKLYVQK